MMPTFHTKRMFVAALLVTAVLVGCYVVMFTIVRNQNERVAKATEDIAEMSAALKTGSTLSSLWDETSPKIQKLETFVVGADGTVPFVEMLEKLGKDAGVKATISSLDLDQEAGGDSVGPASKFQDLKT